MLSKNFSLEGRTALVTGAARGLGLEMAAAFTAAGARTVLHGRTMESLKAAQEQCAALGEVYPIAFDLTDAAAVDAGCERIASEWGEVDVLVNNAGIRERGGMGIGHDRFLAMVESNLHAPFHLARRLAERMKEGGRGGRIINITSVAAHISTANDPAYAATKAGLTALTRTMASAYGPHGITVNALAPGPFLTEYNAELATTSGRGEHIREKTLLKRWGQPGELWGAALFLASDAGSYVTGTTLFVDGGYSVSA